MADDYQYDGGGDYISIVRSTAATVRVIYDPAKNPPGGLATAIQFADPTGPAARVAALFRQPPAPPELAAQLASTTEPVVRRALLIAYFASWKPAAAETAPAAQELAATALRELSPADPMWSLEVSALPAALEAAGDGGESKAYRERVIAEHPSTELAAMLLLDELQTASAAGRIDEARAAYAHFAEPRFAASGLARFAARFDPDAPLAVGKQVPAFTVAALDGKRKPFTPATLRGKITMIDVWATWCHPCQEDLPHLHAVYKKYGKPGGKFQILSVSWDDTTQVVRTLRAAAETPMPWAHAFPTKEQRAQLEQAFLGGKARMSLPLGVLIDEHGKILATNVTGAMLEKLLPTLLATR
jgi:thiol-disulfide isomerase/thioredoxin